MIHGSRSPSSQHAQQDSVHPASPPPDAIVELKLATPEGTPSKTPAATPISERKTEVEETTAFKEWPPAADLDRQALCQLIVDELSAFCNKNPAINETPEQCQARLDSLAPFCARPKLFKLDSELIACIGQPEFEKYPAPLQCGLLVSLVFAKLKLIFTKKKDDRKPDDQYPMIMALKVLVRDYKEHIDDILEVIALQRKYAFEPELLQNQETVDYFANLAASTQFMPAVWMLSRMALSPHNTTVSPGKVLEMLAALDLSKKVNELILSVFALKAEDVETALELSKPSNQTEYDQALWVFSSLFVKHGKRCWPGPEDGFPQPVQVALWKLLDETIEGEKHPEIGDAFASIGMYSRKARDPAMKRTLGLMTGFMGLAAGVPNVEVAMKNKSLSQYQRDIAGLVMAWHLKRQFMTRKADPVRAAEIMERIAKRGSFPLLYRDAAQIYAGFGRYQEAIDCLQAFLKKPLPDYLKESINNQIECYELALEAMESIAAKPREQHKGKNKTSSSASPSEKESSAVDDDWLPEQYKKKTSKKGRSTGGGQKGAGKGKKGKSRVAGESARLTPAPPPVVKTSSKDLKKPKDQVQEKEPEHLPASHETPLLKEAVATGVTPKPAVQAVEKIQKTFRPNGGWSSDHSPVIGRFFRDLRRRREDYDLEGEAICMGEWLQWESGKPAYGRICEEAAWFYLRQLEMPFAKFELLPGEKAENRQQLFDLAAQWLSRAEACYLGVVRDIGSNPAVLRTLIEQTYEQQQELRDDPEFRKRLRSICSSRGHLYSLMAAYSTKWKMYSLYKDRYQGFYLLKRVADPQYSG
ncbi:tetratricopeptide repeat protein [Sansalvadorimonas verongulae]|uniref:tetratricopeptide repeat protein n=1 Tax=Sansalvadorimonas verongulae TaxID=2172824 RepID=UPI0012BC13E6|nr:tetratricopeptide repeat protein [Sansalvadorimonas verongulae]MTI14503.1 hypothetical protein [Sansalvadorimonas verongulae]